VTCETDDDTNTTYTAGTGLDLTGTTFSVNSTVQQRVTGSCSAGSSIRAIAADGTVTCEADDEGSSGGVLASAYGNASFTLSEAAWNYGLLSNTYAPTSNGVCQVNITFQATGLPTSSSSSTFIRTAVERNGVASDDTYYGLYSAAHPNASYSTAVSMSSVQPVIAGTTYRFGCAAFGTGDFRDRSANCRVSYTCF
jgi:hypothetical protein